ncbi:MAG TPA: DUF167 domain-containing protein [Candidatus Paceibacterota bacterium]|nr:DUF167 domain-containing protein [Candidatus Paceibacterota bacterium]HRY76987.1 DUF167 domain-containing protein [Candidatus Paceibacterota bacterium]
MLIKVRVFPNAKKEELSQKSSDSFELRTKAKAERGEANQAAKELLADFFHVSPKQVIFIKGNRSPNKIAKIIC